MRYSTTTAIFLFHVVWEAILQHLDLRKVISLSAVCKTLAKCVGECMHRSLRNPLKYLAVKVGNTYNDNYIWSTWQILLKTTFGLNDLYVCGRRNGSRGECDKYILKLHDLDPRGTPLKVDNHGCFRYLWTRQTYTIRALKQKDVSEILLALIFPIVTNGSDEEVRHSNTSRRACDGILLDILKLLYGMPGYALFFEHSYFVQDDIGDGCDKIWIAGKTLTFTSRSGVKYKLESVSLYYAC